MAQRTNKSTSQLSLRARLRNSVLRGGFMAHKESLISWRANRFKLLVFVSSTFTDTNRERNILLESILPDLKKQGSCQGVEVTFVDMRWGVRDESTIDHKTWEECFCEMKRCYEESSGLFFLSLQADKYGYMPLPRTIDTAVLDTRLQELDEKQVKLILQWYKMDTNSIPSKYILRNLSSIGDTDYWTHVLPTIRDALTGLVFDEEQWPNLEIGQSVTHWEALTALETFENNSKRCLWSHRSLNFEKMRPNDDPAGTLASYHEEDLSWKQYLSTWEQDTKARLQEALSYVVANRVQWEADGAGVGLPGGILSEMLHHCEWAVEKANKFVGRESMLLQGSQLISQPNRDQLDRSKSTRHNTTPFAGISYALIGESGSGKTSLVAKLAATVFEQEEMNEPSQRRPVIIRFCGTSVGSSNGLSLVRSICNQIAHLKVPLNSACPLAMELDKLAVDATSNKEEIYAKAVRILHYLLNKYAVVLFIDSIDQLSDEYLARSRISFLDGVRPHPDTRIIVSALADERDPITRKWIYCYGCDTRLRESDVPILFVTSFGNNAYATNSALETICRTANSDKVDSPGRPTRLQPRCPRTKSTGNLLESTSEFVVILNSLLKSQGRQLTTTQWSIVINAANDEPTALYANLVAGVVTNWKSFDELVTLVPTVKSLLHQIFDDLERHYGTHLTRVAVGLISFSVAGLTDNEIEDLLSLDDNVLTSVFQYATPGIRRLPSHVWLRLRGGMKGMLVERTGGCLVWYHRQLLEVAKSRYSPDEIKHFHSLMGRYFADLVPGQIIEDRKISRQPLTFTPGNIFFISADGEKSVAVNRRRAEECLHHLVEGELFLDAFQQIKNIEVLFSLVYCEVAFPLLYQLDSIQRGLQLKPEYAIASNELFHYIKWLRLDITSIISNPSQRLFATATENQPQKSSARRQCIHYLADTRNLAHGNLHFTKKSWIRHAAIPYHAANKMCRNDGEARVTTLRGHLEQVFGIDWSISGKTLVSGSIDTSIVIWDVMGGQSISKLNGHTGDVRSVAFSPDELLVASCGGDNTIRVWDVQTGVQLAEFLGHTAKIFRVTWRHCGQYLLSASRDGTCRLWNCAHLEASTHDTDPCVAIYRGHTESIVYVSWNGLGTHFVTTAVDRRLSIWAMESTSPVYTIPENTVFAKYVLWLKSKDLVITACVDNGIRIFERKTSDDYYSWYLKRTIECPSVNIINAIAVNDATEQFIVAGSFCGKLLVVDIDTGDPVCFIAGYDPIYDIRWSPGCNLIACGIHTGDILLYDVGPYVGGRSLVEIEDDSETSHSRRSSRSNSLRIAYTTRPQSNSIDNGPGTKDRITTTSVILDGEGGAMLSQFSHSGNTLAVGYHSGTCILWDMLLAAKLHTVNAFDSPISCLSWSNDDKRIVACSLDMVIKIVSVADGSIVSMFATGDNWNLGRSTIWFNNDKWLIHCTAMDTSLNVIQIDESSNMSLLLRFSLELQTVNVICPYEPDCYVALAYYRQSPGMPGISLYSLAHRTSNDSHEITIEDWKLLTTMIGHTRYIRVLAFNHSGNKLASGGIDEAFMIWNIPDGQLLHTLLGHNHIPTGVCWSPDDAMLVTGDLDGVCRCWNVDDGKHVGSYLNYKKTLNGLS